MKKYDVVIIGSGIAGMTAAIYLKRGNLDVLLIDGDTPGGQLNKSYLIENYPGYTSIDGPSLAYNIYEQVTNLNIPYMGEEVKEIDYSKKMVITSLSEVNYDYLVIASGRRPRKLNLKDEDKLIGRGISYCAYCDGNLYKDKIVAVVGGGNSALGDAKYLSSICKKVYLVHRNDFLRADNSLVDEVKELDNIEVILNRNVVSYESKDTYLERIILDNKEELVVDGLFVEIGHVPSSEIFTGIKDNDYIVVDHKGRTSIDNVYACGDVVKKDVYQLTTATGEATTVALDIISKIKGI